MRRSLLAIPAVVVLGAAGLFVWHRESASTAKPDAHVPDVITTGDGRVLPSPFARAGDVKAAAPATPSPAVSQPGTPAAVAAPERPVLPEATTGPADSPVLTRAQGESTRDYLRHAPKADGSSNRQPSVPMPGLRKFQTKLATQQQCQSLEGEKKYAGLTGDARREFAAACQRVGITLPP